MTALLSPMIVLHRLDNVAVARHTLPIGTSINGFIVRQEIPQTHNVATAGHVGRWRRACLLC
jgi:hypothetical protein